MRLLRFAAATATIVACLVLEGRGSQSAVNGADLAYAYGSESALAQARTVHELWRNGDFSAAISASQQGYREALRRKRPRAALFYLNTLASSHFNLGEYRKAQKSYIAARDIALASGTPKWAATALSNLSSLYMHASDTDSALAAAEEAYALSAAAPRERASILLQLGRVLLHRGDAARAHRLFDDAISLSSESGDLRSRAEAWDQLGLETLRSGRLAAAREALRRALFLRKLRSADPNLFATEWKLADLELQSGNIAAARSFIDSAFARPNRNKSQVPQHLMYLTRAQVLSAQREDLASLDDYNRAIDAAEEWRGRSLFADSFRIGADIWLNQIYEGAIDTAARLYQRTRQPRFAELAWQFAEPARSASLREGLAAGQEWTARVPHLYWQTLENLRSLEARHFSDPRNTTAAGDEATRLRMQLAEMEAAALAAGGGSAPALSSCVSPCNSSRKKEVFGENNLNRVSLRGVRNTLGERRVFISFVLGRGASYRWVISRHGLEMKALAGRDRIVQQVESLRIAIRDADAGLADLARSTFAELFGGIRMDPSTHWHISMDDRLFELPVAALVAGSGADAGYLVEKQAFDFVPGAWALGNRAFAGPPRRFVGIGDGIYNTADPRYQAAATASGSWFRLVPALAAGDGPPLQLPRLAASSSEVRSAARESAVEARVLTGTQVNREKIGEALSEAPQFIHIAAHFLVEREGAGIAAVVLGVAPDERGRPGLRLLTSRDIASFRVPGSVVVMSGCSSGAGRTVPAAGVLGLARSWLAAGARAVVATQWPTLDDSGEIFSRFYAHLAREQKDAERVTPAEALRRAQMDMIRSGTWRSDPKHWAAYQIIERSN